MSCLNLAHRLFDMDVSQGVGGVNMLFYEHHLHKGPLAETGPDWDIIPDRPQVLVSCVYRLILFEKYKYLERKA